MAVRIRAEADSDCAECDGFIEQLEEGTDLAIVGFEGGGETAVCTGDLEPYKPEQGDLAKVFTKRQNELLSEVWKLFSQSRTDVPAQLPSAMLPRQARGTCKQTVIQTSETVHFVSWYEHRKISPKC